MNRVQYSFSVPMTFVVKWLLIANVGIWFFLQVVMEGFFKLPFSSLLALTPAKFLFDYAFWQPLTYMFLHSMSVTHIVFNMLMLWFFGAELEQRWGSRFFLGYYLVCGVGAALIYIAGMAIYAATTGHQAGLVVPVIGASGAIFGLLLAHGMIFGERVVYFFMLFPMKAKFFVMIMGAIEFANMMTSSVAGGEVAYLAHLGGIVTGYLSLKFWDKYKKMQWNGKVKKKGRSLRLVVDNEKPADADKPKYWN